MCTTNLHPTVALVTLGCRVNQYETVFMAEQFERAGFRVVSVDGRAWTGGNSDCPPCAGATAAHREMEKDQPNAAGSPLFPACDVMVINTCTVTAESDRKSRQYIRRAKMRGKPCYVVAAGCMAQGDPDQAARAGADLVIGNCGKGSLPALVLQAFAHRTEAGADTPPAPAVCVRDKREDTVFEPMTVTSPVHVRADVKIEDGCGANCSYCIIPKVRGPVRSKCPADVVREVETLAANGYREVVLTGIETSSYGMDLWTREPMVVLRDCKGQKNSVPLMDLQRAHPDPLAALLAQLNRVQGLRRIRMGSLEPTLMTKRFLEYIAPLEKVMPHFHLSLQSGSDRVLAAMRRRYRAEQFLNCVALLRSYFPSASITTDLIVGFPGEQDQDFEQSLALVRQCEFLYVHIFPYSPRSGTVAAGMPEQVLPDIKAARAARMKQEMQKVRSHILQRAVGSTTDILVEQIQDGIGVGLTPRHVEVRVPLLENKGSEGGGCFSQSRAESKRAAVSPGDFLRVRLSTPSSDTAYMNGIDLGRCD